MSLMNRGLVCVGRVLSRNEELVVVTTCFRQNLHMPELKRQSRDLKVRVDCIIRFTATCTVL